MEGIIEIFKGNDDEDLKYNETFGAKKLKEQ